MRRLTIGIAGAGIGGLAAAAALARDGHRVTVHDRFDAPRPVGSGLVIQPVAHAALDRIGAGDAVRAGGAAITRLVGHEARRGRRILDVGYATPDDPNAAGIGIHRSTLFAALLDAARAAGADLIPGREVSEASGGRLCFADGTRSGPFDLIIDACGARSPLSPLRARDLGYGAVWGTVRWPDTTDLPRDALRQSYEGAHRMAGVLPLGRTTARAGDHAAIFWSLRRQDIARWQAEPFDAWRDRVTAFWPAMGSFLVQIGSHADMTPAVYSHGTLGRPAGVALAHIGDAAHRASPQLGQGANMAILDADALALALRKGDVTTALERYVAMRRWHVRLYQWASAAFTPMYQSDSRVLPALRDHLLAPISFVPPVPRILGRMVRGDLIAPVRGRSRGPRHG